MFRRSLGILCDVWGSVRRAVRERNRRSNPLLSIGHHYRTPWSGNRRMSLAISQRLFTPRPQQNRTTQPTLRAYRLRESYSDFRETIRTLRLHLATEAGLRENFNQYHQLQTHTISRGPLNNQADLLMCVPFSTPPGTAGGLNLSTGAMPSRTQP
jgi:hypothetical protein